MRSSVRLPEAALRILSADILYLDVRRDYSTDLESLVLVVELLISVRTNIMKSATLVLAVMGVSVVVIGAIVIYYRSRRENLAYLDTYEAQDHYKNQPDSWPVVDTATTALVTIQREQIEKDREVYGRSSSCLY